MINNNYDIVERKAKDFIWKSIASPPLIDEFIDELKVELAKYYRTSDKTRYLTFLSEFMGKQLEEHLKECIAPINCKKTKLFREAIFFIDQVIEEYDY